jgi:hypothetical protein
MLCTGRSPAAVLSCVIGTDPPGFRCTRQVRSSAVAPESGRGGTRSLAIRGRDKWSDRPFGERDRADQRFLGQKLGIAQLWEQDDRVGVEQTLERWFAHSEGSSTASTSSRRRSGSTCGSRRHLASSTEAAKGLRGTGRNSATGLLNQRGCSAPIAVEAADPAPARVSYRLVAWVGHGGCCSVCASEPAGGHR